MDQSVFEELIQEQLPEVAERLRDPSALASLSLSWFLTLFLSIMPLESAVHVVDCFFYDGIKVVFQLGLAVLEANAGALCNSRDDGQALMLLSRCARLRAVLCGMRWAGAMPAGSCPSAICPQVSPPPLPLLGQAGVLPRKGLWLSLEEIRKSGV